MATREPLRFVVAPHIVQDLGLNLYTDLPRVLVEFVANAYDADSPWVEVNYPKDAIDRARRMAKALWGGANDRKALEDQVLPEDLKITIEDRGHGMSREQLGSRFLIAGRRRRDADNSVTSENGRRTLMGRKGLGKLAGFGVAQRVEVVTRRAGESRATRIVLDYNDLIRHRDVGSVTIPDEDLPASAIDGASGTRVTLSKLLYGPMQSKVNTIADALAEHLMYVEPSDFAMRVNGKEIPPFHRPLAYAWPAPERPLDELVDGTIRTEEFEYTFQYRMRFTAEREALPGKERGVRVYTHGRLAAAPSLLAADTNMHGFRMTDYMDGIVRADFIDEQLADYVATDRQSLRWDSTFLQPLHKFLSDAIKDACKAYQAKRDKDASENSKVDAFTVSLIQAANLSKRHSKLAYRVAGLLASSEKLGVESPAYRMHLEVFIKGLGQGKIMAALAELANQAHPALDRVVAEITQLTADELDQFHSYVKVRLNGIEALRRVVMDRDFKKERKEKVIQKLFEDCPWLIDPTFFEFLAADVSEKTVQDQLAKELKVGKYAPRDHDPNDRIEVTPGEKNERPDLVFFLASQGLQRLVIVELKAPNTPLHGDHLVQLQGYMDRAKAWFGRHGRAHSVVEGLLIGSRAPIASRASKVEWLEARIAESQNERNWRVYDYLEVLDRTESAHRELLQVRRRLEERSEASEA